MKEGYKLEDTIILNGKVGWVSTGDDADSIIGIQNIQKVKRFSGEEIIVSNSGFAFSKEMESRCGWLNRYASIQMLTDYWKKGDYWEDYVLEVVGHGINKVTGKPINFVGKQTGL